MSDKTAIEWTAVPDGHGGFKRGATWNPLRGCTAVSAGCDNCFAASIALRFSAPGLPYEGLATQGEGGHPEWTGKIMLVPDHLADPLRWREPRGVFVNSMSDLFHPGVPIGFIDQVFAVMAAARRHTFQVLTKRPQIMANYLADPGVQERIERAGDDLAGTLGWCNLGGDWPGFPWPLPNVWVGASVENQRATSRINALMRCPATVRFLSCEPLLGPLDLSRWLDPPFPDHPDPIKGVYRFKLLDQWFVYPGANWIRRDLPQPERWGPKDHGLHWVITGGESGRYHRPLDPDWVRTIRDDCLAANVAYFHKQNGGPTSKSGGKDLDGREWCDFPVVGEAVAV